MAPFSPKDVIAEYTRPARVIRDGGEVVLPALSERHFIEVPEHGQMEAFLTDGLRSLLETIPAVEMSEYTIRWPGHIQRFIELGLQLVRIPSFVHIVSVPSFDNLHSLQLLLHSTLAPCPLDVEAWLEARVHAGC